MPHQHGGRDLLRRVGIAHRQADDQFDIRLGEFIHEACLSFVHQLVNGVEIDHAELRPIWELLGNLPSHGGAIPVGVVRDLSHEVARIACRPSARSVGEGNQAGAGIYRRLKRCLVGNWVHAGIEDDVGPERHHVPYVRGKLHLVEPVIRYRHEFDPEIRQSVFGPVEHGLVVGASGPVEKSRLQTHATDFANLFRRDGHVRVPSRHIANIAAR